ncbi:phosphoribosyltransferase family protein [Kitasatospora sp. NPDC050463]|uniref:phosphoribosyltransferase n=1 Tax=Kitasatospora sp. NPDC050463 TaxID=3155786 RepID=UPI00340B2B41
MRFRDRTDAGRQLATALAGLGRVRRWPDPIVLALPRGGVPVAAEVARALDAPLDVLVTRTIGTPGQPELQVGAIAGEDPPVFDRRAMKLLDVATDELAAEVDRQRTELHRRERLYRRDRPEPVLHGRTAILVDDGLATGVSARAALRRIRAGRPARTVLAVPVCDTRTAEELRHEADEFVCLSPHRYLHAIGVWYDSFHEVSDREVAAVLDHRPAIH